MTNDPYLNYCANYFYDVNLVYIYSQQCLQTSNQTFTCKLTNYHPKHINDVLDAYLKFNVHGQK
jgi:hypothetical protein